VRPLMTSMPVDSTVMWFSHYQITNDLFINPARAGASAPTLYELERSFCPAAEATLLILAAGAASAGDIAQTTRFLDESIDNIHHAGNDDGLPDLLLPLAVLAWRLDDTARARRLITAIRHASRPTHNLTMTIAYRQLRQILGTDEPPPTPIDHAALFAETRAWLAKLSNTAA